MSKQIGIFSGTFDPVHAGHIAFCLEAVEICKLDEVWLIPETHPRNKDNVSDILHRTAMLELGIYGLPRLNVKQLSSDQFSAQNSLPELKEMAQEARLTLLIGSDVAKSFLNSWPDFEDIITNFSFAVGLRSDDTENDMTALFNQLARIYKPPIQYTLIPSPHAYLTSTHVRASKNNAGLHELVTDYIKHHNLY